MSRLLAVGDIHGCSKTLYELLWNKIKITKNDRLVFIGDYIDRGPDSKGVVEQIIKLRNDGFTVYALRGNHEQLLLDSRNGPLQRQNWMVNGGDDTLKSYGIASIDELDLMHFDFFSNTLFFLELDNFIFAHAGINFSRQKPLEDLSAMLWIRNFKIKQRWLRDRILVHGHTPLTYNKIISQPFEGAIDIDGGCVYYDKPQLGNLFAADLTNRIFISQSYCE
jgi:serine/threonine protein phosphatase 1